ncbi:MAG: hypothetical protein AAGI69_29605 [Cyanobacteria bacterium P01_H01_bin.21]
MTLQQPDDSLSEVVLFALGDLDDGDNNHERCLDTADTPVFVSFPAGYLSDLNNDVNPATTIQIEQY